MATRKPAGLDELMIVNPGSPAMARAVILRRTRSAHQGSASGADVQPEACDRGGMATANRRGPGRFFLGEDGALYEVIE